VAVLLNKVVLEYIPKYGQRLADEVRKWGVSLRNEADKKLAEFYPSDRDGATPIAYLWARTVKCEGPGCGAEIPLIRSLWLAQRPGKSVAIRLVPNSKAKRVDFEIVEDAKPNELGEGTVKRGSANCPCCGFTTHVASVRRQLKERHGGAADARLFAVVMSRPGQQGRFYRLPQDRDLEAISAAAECLKRIGQKRGSHDVPAMPLPNEPTPEAFGHRAVSSCRVYGFDCWADLFAPRQSLALATLSSLVSASTTRLRASLQPGLADAVQTCLALSVDRLVDFNSSLSRWASGREGSAATFGRQTIPMLWDFAETCPLASSTGGLKTSVELIASIISRNCEIAGNGNATVALSTAVSHPLPDDIAQCLFTDPPYYDAIPYADLADFFYVWLKRSVSLIHPECFRDQLTPKQEQAIVWHPNSGEEKLEFERKMFQSMGEGRRVLAPDGIGVIVFAHKSTAGWEAQLQAMVSAGWVVTASWPIDTERSSRSNAAGTASLASSIHLICRPREDSNGKEATNIGDWRDVLQELPRRIHDWMPRLAGEGVVGADAIFACLGPALEIYSRYSRVEKASGEQVTLREYLEHVWAAVAEEALKMIFEGADAKGFEEDSRLTAMWLWTLSTGNGSANGQTPGDVEDDEEKTPVVSGYALEYDAARKIAQGLGAHLENVSSLIEVKGDKAVLLPVASRTRHLFGKEEQQSPRQRAKQESQMNLLSALQEVQDEESGWGEKTTPPAGSTVLDRVHQALILFAANRGEALKRFLVEDGVGKDHRFWKLAQSLSALYPKDSDEKRWVDGVLGKKKSLGF
jgi:putative DNA methylase